MHNPAYDTIQEWELISNRGKKLVEIYTKYFDVKDIVKDFISKKYKTPEPLEYYPNIVDLTASNTLKNPRALNIELYTSTPKEIAIDFLKRLIQYLQACPF